MQAFTYRDGELYCEDVPVSRLAEQHGTPVWIYSKSFILGQLKQIQTAFADVNPVICYSVKANSNLGILKVIRDAGCSFDVVSGGELYRVKAAGRHLVGGQALSCIKCHYFGPHPSTMNKTEDHTGELTKLKMN